MIVSSAELQSWWLAAQPSTVHRFWQYCNDRKQSSDQFWGMPIGFVCGIFYMRCPSRCGYFISSWPQVAAYPGEYYELRDYKYHRISSTTSSIDIDQISNPFDSNPDEILYRNAHRAYSNPNRHGLTDSLLQFQSTKAILSASTILQIYSQRKSWKNRTSKRQGHQKLQSS